MINANETRLGNWVEYKGKRFQLYVICADLPTLNTINFGFGVVEWKDLNPIKLSPEVLEKCGFDTDQFKCWSKINLPNSPNILSINGGNGVGHGTTWLKNKEILGINLPSCIYLHQLQNLFWCLCGKELTVNL